MVDVEVDWCVEVCIGEFFDYVGVDDVCLCCVVGDECGDVEGVYVD